jgi:SAM-dependent methyltransferase
MDRNAALAYRCPYTAQRLSLRVDHAEGDEVISGALIAEGGGEYPVQHGLPLLIRAEGEKYDEAEQREYEYYQATYQSYDSVMDWVFKSFYEDEAEVRGRMVDLLELTPSSRVLETGSGTCRDSVHIARRLGPDGELYMQDLSPNMLRIGRDRVRDSGVACRTAYFVGNACHLPFPDGHFDAAFHFGGLNVFADKRQAIAEMARVVRVGGKVVVGDEGLGPWHRGTPYGNILINSSKLYQNEAPVECLPECARDACVRWLLGNAYYLLEFRVGQGPPALDMDLPIQGKRGGTHRTRYYGVLEGVTVEAKELALKAAAASGLSVHEWLDRAVRQQARGGQADDRTALRAG